MSRKTLSEILNGRAGISPEMAIRLAVALDTTLESWMAQQPRELSRALGLGDRGHDERR